MHSAGERPGQTIMTVQVYPNAYHSFDLPNNSLHAFAHSYAGHMVGYDAEATADARRRVLEFLARFMR